MVEQVFGLLLINAQYGARANVAGPSREPLSESVEEHREKKQRKYQEKNSTPHTVHTSLFCLGPACRSRKVLLFKASKKTRMYRQSFYLLVIYLCVVP